MAIKALMRPFPLYTYEEADQPAQGPNEKQLWVYGSKRKSFDLACLRWQAALRFAAISNMTYLAWDFDDGAVNGQLASKEVVARLMRKAIAGHLPSLHLSSGSLLSSEELPAWLDTQIKVSEDNQPTPEQMSESEIWISLITKSVVPLLVCP